MSAAAAVETRTVMTETKTFRGSSLEEVLPQIKADLGPDAEIVRQREGLTGGVGGFFQRACIEVDARPGDAVEDAQVEVPRFSAYDDEAEEPAFEPDPLPRELPDAATTEGLTAPGIQEILRQAVPFADHLDIAASRVQREPALAAEREAAPEPQPSFEPVRYAPTPAPVAMPAQPTAGARPQVADAIE